MAGHTALAIGECQTLQEVLNWCCTDQHVFNAIKGGTQHLEGALLNSRAKALKMSTLAMSTLAYDPNFCDSCPHTHMFGSALFCAGL